ncbi:PH-like domain-containing protein [Agromyces zhanjiangensis]|uniref:PH-like domain-containing protein n=1 Tax=Agromyces zhanjiangensis TaxID=3158562 RepID=UPI003390FC4C
MDSRWIGALVAVAIVAVAAWLMWRSWRRRTVRDETLAAYGPPADPGSTILEIEALYVATTPEGDPLERLAVEGLAFRGSARVEVHRTGVLLRVAGEHPSFIPADRIAAAGTATYAIDRGVEPEGLVALTWIVDDRSEPEVPTRVDSYLRCRYPGDSARFVAAVNEIAAAPEAPQPDAEESEASDG